VRGAIIDQSGKVVQGRGASNTVERGLIEAIGAERHEFQRFVMPEAVAVVVDGRQCTGDRGDRQRDRERIPHHWTQIHCDSLAANRPGSLLPENGVTRARFRGTA
jgi:hypothetical protein